ncbi:leaf-specific thionin DB4-like [Hordeum vulgare subsp. vulgare]|uniref:leaf-specific thionin DB4-like n=1 Tax=Hordeum vulgare subsp. vulgare TaxID=112509 RepID=UPI000B475811|nr:leaf-specific thionin DB4-like [Hordeum vulgare subsp. vulgare]
MAPSKSIKSVVICVLILGLVLEQVQVEGKSCCKTTFARNCYNTCRFAGGSRPVCAGACGCKIISGSKCPSDYPKLNLLPESGEPDVTQYCTIGCRNSVCDNVDNVFRGQKMKFDMGLCSNACARFCNDGAVIQSVEA